MKLSQKDIQARKEAGIPISAITCYDFPSARWIENANIDIVLVGDSVGTNVLGYASESEVTLDDIAHHLRAVRRGIKRAYLLADLPYGTYTSPEQALTSAQRLVADGADGIKLEGFIPDIIQHLAKGGIQVFAHLGLMPQLAEKVSLQARTAETALQLLQEALGLETAGACGLILELVPEEISAEVSKRLTIPTIGIGAGRSTDGQVLVFPDALGFNEMNFRHNRKFANIGAIAMNALSSFSQAVRDRTFPETSHVRHMPPKELDEFLSRIHEVTT